MQRAFFIATAFFVAACSGDDGGGGSPDSGVNGDAGSDFDEPNGVITVTSNPQFSAIGLVASFQDGPPLEVRSAMSQTGACRLMTYQPSFCDPACGPTEFCVDGTCEAFPGRIDKGALEWTFPGGQMTVNPDNTLFYSASGTVSEHGSTEVTVDGETLQVDTSAAPTPDADWSQAFEQRSGDVTLRWTDPIAGARVRLSMTDCVGSHGGIGEFEIECEAPDSGALTVPDAFVTALEGGDWGRGECGSHSVTRYVVDDAADGSFRLEAASAAGFFYFPRD